MPPDTRPLLGRYQQQISRYRGLAASALVGVWDGLGSYDEKDVATLEAQVGPALDGAKQAAVALSVAFFAFAVDTPLPAISASSVRVVPDLRQPFTAAWHALSQGRPYDEAVQAGRSVAEAVGFDFVQSVSRRTGDAVAEASGRRVRWQRIPDPDACQWCVTVAGGSYRTAESADFGHSRCACDVIPA